MLKLGLSILMNNTCNMRCKYCYEYNKGDEIITKENILSIFKRFESCSFFNKDVEFFGGEPTLNINVIKYIYDLYPDYSYRIISNGYFLTLNEEEYSFMSNFTGVVISLELTKKSYLYYRNSNNLDLMIEKIVKLNKKWKNISINVSINSHLNENLDEFLNYVNFFNMNKIPIHFYSLKYDSGFNERGFYEFLLKIKEKNLKIFKQIILADSSKTDIEYTCTFNDRITINSNMKIVECSWMKNNEIHLNNTDEEIITSYINSLSKNHKTCFNGCKDCDVEIGKCSISCRAFFEQIEKNNNIQLLERLCNLEKIKEYLRRETIECQT